VADVTAPEKGMQNGKIFLSAEGGTPPYSYEWSDAERIYTDAIVYEAENAEVKIPGHIISSYDDAGNRLFSVSKGMKVQ
jgi:hypothetical protein